MRIHCFQHMPAEGPGTVAQWAAERGHELCMIHWYSTPEPVPEPADIQLLLLLGGAMGVHDETEYPWLLREKALLRVVMAAGKPVLGICLGSQLIAQALGATVGRNQEPEVGFHPVHFTAAARQHRLLRHLPAQATVLHWHFDAFSLPPGTHLIGTSGATACQGFVLGAQVVGLQFHPEATPEFLATLIRAEGHELPAGPYVQALPKLRTGAAALPQSQPLLFPLLDALVEQVFGQATPPKLPD